MKLAKEIALWAICLFLVYVFVRAGVDKFSDSSGWARAFRFWDYPVWFRILVGVAEVTAAGLLLYKRTAGYGALLIMIVMLGGMATHVVTHRPKQVTSEVFPLTLATLVFFGRRKQMLLPQRAAARPDTRLPDTSGPESRGSDSRGSDSP
jgi:putative oxidoreductase